MKRWTVYTLGVLLSLGMLSGCGSGGSSMNKAAAPQASFSETASSSAAMDYGYADDVAEAEEAPMEPSPGAMDGGSSGEMPSVVSEADKGRKIIYHVDMSLETTEFETSLAALNDAVNQAGGFTESSSVSGNSIYSRGGKRYASLIVRIPPEKLDSFLSSVRGICNVLSTSQQKEDITSAYTDTEARKRALEVEQERLFALLEKADSIETIIALETRLSEVRYQLDSFSSQLRVYDEKVNYSTVTLDLNEVERVSDPVPRTVGERIRTGFSGTLYDIQCGFQDFVVWAVVNLPYLLILAVFVLIIVLLVRWSLRRSARRRAARPTETPPAPQGENFYRADPSDDKPSNQ